MLFPESKKKYLYSCKQFEEIMESVEEAVANVAEKICDGRIEASPKTGKNNRVPCEYCEFKPICRSVKTK